MSLWRKFAIKISAFALDYKTITYTRSYTNN